MPSRSGKSDESRSSALAAATNSLTGLFGALGLARRIRQKTVRRERFHGSREAPLGDGKLDRLGKPNRPGHQRREHQPEQDRLHQHVRGDEHSPRAEIARQFADGRRWE